MEPWLGHLLADDLGASQASSLSLDVAVYKTRITMVAPRELAVTPVT